MSGSEVKILFYGIGNPSRGDDALGPLGIEYLREHFTTAPVDFHWNYQLQIEDAEFIDNYEIVIFIDAHAELDRPIVFQKLNPTKKPEFTTHQVDPESILALNHQHFGRHQHCYLLALRAEDFELGEELSDVAKESFQHLIKWSRSPIPSELIAKFKHG